MRILYHTRVRHATGSNTYKEGVLSGLKSRLTYLGLYPRDLSRINFDLVHVLDLKHLDIPTMIRLHKLDIPIILDLHDHYWATTYPYLLPDLPLRRILALKRRFIYRRFFQRAEAIIVHSKCVNAHVLQFLSNNPPLLNPPPRGGRSGGGLNASTGGGRSGGGLNPPSHDGRSCGGLNPFTGRGDIHEPENRSLKPYIYIVRYGLGLIPESRAPSPETRNILFIGRDFFRKGLPLLLRALKSVRRRIPDVKLTVAGDDYVHSRLSMRIASSRLPVVFTGGLTRGHTLKLLGEAAMLVLPSFIEATPWVVLEAWSRCTPVIVCRTDGLKEMIQHERNGLLVNIGDVEGLYQGIIRIFNDRHLVENIVHGGLETLKSSYSLENMLDGIMEVYRRVLSGK